MPGNHSWFPSFRQFIPPHRRQYRGPRPGQTACSPLDQDDAPFDDVGHPFYRSDCRLSLFPRSEDEQPLPGSTRIAEDIPGQKCFPVHHGTDATTLRTEFAPTPPATPTPRAGAKAPAVSRWSIVGLTFQLLGSPEQREAVTISVAAPGGTAPG